MHDQSNLQRFQAVLAETDLPAFLVSDMPNVRWLTGFTGSFGFAIVTRDAGVFISDSRYTLQASEEIPDLQVHTFANPTNVDDFLYEHLQKLGVTRLGFDRNHLTVAKHQTWESRFSGMELVPHDDPIAKLRMIKNADEIRRIREACRLADDCMRHVVDRIAAGVSELALLGELESFLRAQHSRPSFDPIVVSGPRSARPHGVPSAREVERGDLVTLDLGAVVDGYCSDITRTVVVGQATDRQRIVYEQVLKAEQLGISRLVPGASGREIDGEVRSLLEEKNLAQYFGHGLGHGLGGLVHDSGRLSPTIEQTIEAGQVWTVEPGVYIEGFGGIRIEDDVLVQDSGPEVLTFFPRDLLEV